MVITLGELMLRLKAPGKQRLLQGPTLEASFGGGEANVAAALAWLGHAARFVTILPTGPLGDEALAGLRGDNVDTSAVLRKPGRLGLYFLEEGGAQRPSKVVYDREGAPIASARLEDWDWNRVLQNGRWFHLTGITPALSEAARQLSIQALDKARAAGLTVSLDLNYRKNLWKYGLKAAEVMPELAARADLLLGNEEDLQLALGLTPARPHKAGGAVDLEVYRDLADQVFARWPQVTHLALTLRESLNADHNRWSGLLVTQQELWRSPIYDIYPIVDRVGAGDSFAAGLIHGFLAGESPRRTVELAAALSCLKHSLPGDVARFRLDEVEALAAGDGSGRVQR